MLLPTVQQSNNGPDTRANRPKYEYEKRAAWPQIAGHFGRCRRNDAHAATNTGTDGCAFRLRTAAWLERYRRIEITRFRRRLLNPSYVLCSNEHPQRRSDCGF